MTMKTMISNHPRSVKRTTSTFSIADTEVCKKQMLSWANRFNICCFLDNHSYASPHGTVECIAGVDAETTFEPSTDIINQLDHFNAQHSDWLFGHLGYDLKNEIAHTHSSHPDQIGFPDLLFFQPETVLQLRGNELTVSCIHRDPAAVYASICKKNIESPAAIGTVNIHQRIAKEEYIEIIEKLRSHILRGDCYEINFCQEFYAEGAEVDALQVYRQLTSISPNPFSCFYKLQDKYVLCASPERFLQKKGTRLISQPIKGTFRRDRTDPATDHRLKMQLQQSEKDKSENVMVVDLVRNDLSRICEEGSVHVEELFGIYSFPQVHQMISTIAGTLRPNTPLSAILSATFPMGSMTGAPKLRVMELVEQYEKTRRGIYSGAIGYISPEKDFDFNVVIRSILYNATNRYLSYLVGGGITFYSDPEKEYEECLLKAEAIKKVLSR